MAVDLESGYELVPIRTARGQTEAVVLQLVGVRAAPPPPLIFMLRAGAAALIGQIQAALNADNNLRYIARAIMRLEGYEGAIAAEVSIDNGFTPDPMRNIHAAVNSMVSAAEYRGEVLFTMRLTLLRNIEISGLSDDNTESLMIHAEPASIVMFGLNLQQALYPRFEAEIIDRLEVPK